MKSLPAARYANIAGRLMENMWKREAINPFYASYKITNTCEYRCKFCNVWQEKTPDLDTPDVLRVLDNLERAGTFVLSLEGGEPLLRDDIGEVLEHIGRKRYFLLFTTCQRDMLERPMEEYCRNIDFLHISIDEGHDNLDMFELLPEAVKWGSIVAVQVVVTQDDLPALEDKVARCHAVGAKCVVMPAVHLNHTRDYFPDVEAFERENLRLKKKYPLTIVSPDAYFRSLREEHGCSTGSIIIDSDGGLFYPCRTLEHKPINLVDTDLHTWLRSEQAGAFRNEMAQCQRNCGWYQYYAINDFTSPMHVFNAVAPYARQFFNDGNGSGGASLGPAPQTARRVDSGWRESAGR